MEKLSLTQVKKDNKHEFFDLFLQEDIGERKDPQ